MTEDVRSVRLRPGETPSGSYKVAMREESDGHGGVSQVLYAVFSTFRDACYARGIFQHDDEWLYCFEEAISLRTGWELRRMFTALLLQGEVTDALPIWNHFAEHICERLHSTDRLGRFSPFSSVLFISNDFLLGLSSPPTLENPNLDYGLYLIATDPHAEDKSGRLQLAVFPA